MRAHLLSAICFIAFSSFEVHDASLPSTYQKTVIIKSPENTIDFTVKRLSGGRVYISWRTEGESGKVSFEVLRKPKQLSPYTSLGVVQPKTQTVNSSLVEYIFVDNNDLPDTCYYCLRKKNEEGVLFYSMAKPVEGVGKNR